MGPRVTGEALALVGSEAARKNKTPSAPVSAILVAVERDIEAERGRYARAVQLDRPPDVSSPVVSCRPGCEPAVARTTLWTPCQSPAVRHASLVAPLASGSTQFGDDVDVPVNGSFTSGEPRARRAAPQCRRERKSRPVSIRQQPRPDDVPAWQSPQEPRCTIAHIDSARHKDRGTRAMLEYRVCWAG